MLDHILTVELPIPADREDEWNRWYHAEHMPSLLNEVPAIRRGTRYRLLSGDPAYSYVVLYEFPTEPSMLAFMHSQTISRKHSEYRERWGTVNRRGGWQRVWQMRRPEVGAPPAPVSGPQELGEAPAQILTVRLPVPANREDEWNRWYHTEHMPSVMGQVDQILLGHRFRPLDGAPDDPYFQIYEFATRAALDEWQTGMSVQQRRGEYEQRWGVHNNRRAFEAVFEIEGMGQA
jgi:hypothetical protein